MGVTLFCNRLLATASPKPPTTEWFSATTTKRGLRSTSARMVTSGTMTHRLKRLEARRWVARVPNAQDARSTLVQLTADGLALIERAVEAHVDNERTMLSVLPADVLRDLDAQLSHLLRALEPSNHGADATPAS